MSLSRRIRSCTTKLQNGKLAWRDLSALLSHDACKPMARTLLTPTDTALLTQLLRIKPGMLAS